MDIGAVQVHRFSLPHLPLDRTIPRHVLAHRRGAISFSSGSSLFEGLPRLERRGGISYDRNDIDAQYVRMLGDIGIRRNLDKSRKANRLGSMARLPQLPSSTLINENDTSTTINETTVDNCTARRRYRNCMLLRRSSIGTKFSDNKSYFNASKHTHLPTLVLDTEYPGLTQASGKEPIFIPVIVDFSPRKLIVDISQMLLDNADEWEFDTIKLDLVTRGHPLFNLAMHLFQKHNLIATLDLDVLKLMRLCKLIEESYHRRNPFHNSTHAADVTQAVHCYLLEAKIADSLSEIEIFYSLLAALLHDIDHPGVNQNFLIATSHFLPKIFGVISVLENHHCRAAIALLRDSGVIEHLPSSQRRFIEDQIVALILSTDMAKQQEYLSKFKLLVDNDTFNINNHDHKTLMLQIALKCADISNPCRSWHLCSRWSKRVTSEFFDQGNKEKELGIEISPLFDDTKHTTADIQVGFYQYVARPLFSCWSDFLHTPLCDMMLENMNDNLVKWDKVVKSEKN
ncbi:High affinity cAMP-specific 3',5'-cyclic phosphodiesterase 7A [Trichoplax sp. H2]|nr:High affinity cAMP-specific 3',5'-cyclic phosphodiesterase 7A [Trichoplax sp. H2]|eukprot:RDD46227.1 High affinity cAMP-specific 3',5'-cyclic phosphodiesterase 7A [Trichoplax sp. H2]